VIDPGLCNVSDQVSLADQLATEFARFFGRPPAGRWAAPGRVNLIGEHTDYNGGFVLPLAIQLRVLVAAAVAPGSVSTVRSAQQARVVQFCAAEAEPGSVTGWASYVAGVAWALRMAGYAVPDVDLFVNSDVPLGAGLSSSAALGCAVACAFVELAGLAVDGPELALLVHRGENDYVGAPTGVMDPIAALLGRAGHVVFLDSRSLAIESLPFDPGAQGLRLLIMDTRMPHRLVDGQYAQRRLECRRAAAALGVPTLRDVPAEDIDHALQRLPSVALRRRVRHVVSENARVLEVVGVLRAGGDLQEIGPALTASHISLRDDFEVTVAQLDLAVDTALAVGAHGARMTGGGFGGCVLALVDADRVDAVCSAVDNAFRLRGFEAPAMWAAVASAGAGRLCAGNQEPM